MVKLPSLVLGQESLDRVRVVVAVLKEIKGEMLSGIGTGCPLTTIQPDLTRPNVKLLASRSSTLTGAKHGIYAGSLPSSV